MEELFELESIRRDYLRDVREKIVSLEAETVSLGSESGFKTAFPAMLFISHQLKGSGGTLGFPRISIAAERIAERLRAFLEDVEPSQTPPHEFAGILLGLVHDLATETTRAETGLPGD
jgi:chemotaxis protein histidine kinase CheA